MSIDTSVVPELGSTAITRPARSFTSSQPSGVAVMLIGDASPLATSVKPSGGGLSAIGSSVGAADAVGVGAGDVSSGAVEVATGISVLDGSGDVVGAEHATSTTIDTSAERATRTAFIGRMVADRVGLRHTHDDDEGERAARGRGRDRRARARRRRGRHAAQHRDRAHQPAARWRPSSGQACRRRPAPRDRRHLRRRPRPARRRAPRPCRRRRGLAHAQRCDRSRTTAGRPTSS